MATARMNDMSQQVVKDSVIAWLEKLCEEDRCKFFDGIAEKFCPDCGNEQGDYVCCCMRDD